ncbi:MAG: hypothetical protein CTY20_12360 [Hyphomicrobium sp.]|nr:MAG: hypothetical protein CTY20_12360 [Hyphomicrobium sp.]
MPNGTQSDEVASRPVRVLTPSGERLPVQSTAERRALVPPVVYLLADHLDAVLARGEDLLATSWSPDCTARCAATISDTHRNQRQIIDDIRTSEMALVSRALKAQGRARELATRDFRFRPMARLFAAGTVALQDAAREAGDQTAQDFDTGDGIVAYLRGRGVIAGDAGSLDDCGSIRVTAKFLVVRRIELGPLLDLVAMFLDTLELHYDLYPDLPDQEPVPTAVATVEADLEPDRSLAAVELEPAAAEHPAGDERIMPAQAMTTAAPSQPERDGELPAVRIISAPPDPDPSPTGAMPS